MEIDLLVNCSTPFLVASRSDATPCNTTADTIQGGGPSPQGVRRSATDFAESHGFPTGVRRPKKKAASKKGGNTGGLRRKRAKSFK